MIDLPVTFKKIIIIKFIVGSGLGGGVIPTFPLFPSSRVGFPPWVVEVSPPGLPQAAESGVTVAWLWGEGPWGSLT